jgi:hypothetical protein
MSLQPRLSEEQRRELEALAKPMIDWLNRNMHPHSSIIIDTTSCQLVEGVSAFTTMEFVRD